MSDATWRGRPWAGTYQTPSPLGGGATPQGTHIRPRASKARLVGFGIPLATTWVRAEPRPACRRAGAALCAGFDPAAGGTLVDAGDVATGVEVPSPPHPLMTATATSDQAALNGEERRI